MAEFQKFNLKVKRISIVKRVKLCEIAKLWFVYAASLEPAGRLDGTVLSLCVLATVQRENCEKEIKQKVSEYQKTEKGADLGIINHS